MSDLSSGLGARRARLGGRVCATDARQCELGDALARVRIFFHRDEVLSIGDLVIVEGQFDGEHVRDAELCDRDPRPEPRGDGDYARLAWHGVGRNLQSRARVLGSVRAHFEREGFLEVETPVRVPAPGVDFRLDAIPAEGGYLITSPELHMKRLLAAGLPRIFQFARASRRDELGRLHEPEFTMLEWYRSFAGLEAMLADTERVLCAIAESASGRPALRGPDGARYDLARPFPRVTVREAFREYANVEDAVDLSSSDEDRYFELFVSHVEPGLARETRPIFLWQYPANQAALARLSPTDPSVAQRFELYVAGVELCNGFDELTDATEQRARFELEQRRRQGQGRSVYPIDECFLAALESGMPQASGNALGFDRALMLALGARDISEVMAFPSRFI